MLKRSIIIASVILTVCLAIAFPVCRGRILSAKLVEAVEQKNGDLVENLLDKGANPNSKNKTGIPLLHIAVEKCSREIVKLLIDKGADIGRTLDVVSPSHIDDRTGRPVMVSGITALNGAIEKRDVEMLELLLAGGANANNITSVGQMPFFRALFDKRTNLGKAILTIKTKNHYYDLTPLHLAVSPVNNRPDPGIVKLLLEHGADVDAAGGDFDSTPLRMAITPDINDNCPDPEIIKLLLEYGANADGEDKLGIRPLKLAVLNNCPEIAKLLLDYGADVNMRTKNVSVLLHGSVFFGNTDMVELLLNYGIDTDTVNDRGGTALDIAINRGCDDITEILRKHGVRTGAELKAEQ